SPGVGWVSALHRQTGEVAWRKGRKTGQGSYGSPTVAPLDGKPQLVLAGGGDVTAYDPANGNILWTQHGLGDVTANTATVSPTMAFASSGSPKRTLLALKGNGSVAWQKDGNDAPYPPSMLWHDGHLYVVSDQ